MWDCSPATLGSNRVTNTTANLSSSGKLGFWRTWAVQQLLPSCYFQTSACCCGSRNKALCCPPLPQRSNFSGQEKAAVKLLGALGKKSGSNLVFSAIPIKTQYLKGETKCILQMPLILPGRFELKYFHGPSVRCLGSKLDGSHEYFYLEFFWTKGKGGL